jgi:hypothetical protein
MDNLPSKLLAERDLLRRLRIVGGIAATVCSLGNPTCLCERGAASGPSCGIGGTGSTSSGSSNSQPLGDMSAIWRRGQGAASGRRASIGAAESRQIQDTP